MEVHVLTNYIDRIVNPFTIVLPTPPSVNAAWINIKNGRAKSQKYKDWLRTAKAMYMAVAKGEQLEPPYLCIYEINKVNNIKRDCANYEKCLSDFFVSAGLMKDDSLIECNVQCWLHQPDAGHITRCNIFSLNKEPPISYSVQ